jgi:hypothetical protein
MEALLQNARKAAEAAFHPWAAGVVDACQTLRFYSE